VSDILIILGVTFWTVVIFVGLCLIATGVSMLHHDCDKWAQIIRLIGRDYPAGAKAEPDIVWRDCPRGTLGRFLVWWEERHVR
jgi:hypothetical protein